MRLFKGGTYLPHVGAVVGRIFNNEENFGYRIK